MTIPGHDFIFMELRKILDIYTNTYDLPDMRTRMVSKPTQIIIPLKSYIMSANSVNRCLDRANGIGVFAQELKH